MKKAQKQTKIKKRKIVQSLLFPTQKIKNARRIVFVCVVFGSREKMRGDKL